MKIIRTDTATEERRGAAIFTIPPEHYFRELLYTRIVEYLLRRVGDRIQECVICGSPCIPYDLNREPEPPYICDSCLPSYGKAAAG